MSPRRRDRPEYGRLPTEAPFPGGEDLERRSIEEIVGVLLGEEARAVALLGRAAPALARAAALVVERLRAGGRLVYVGAGTSGRLGALDAAELPPTFGSSPRRVIALVAGGDRALKRSVEGAEDRTRAAQARLTRLRIGPRDVVCGIAASGVTPFVRHALQVARARGAATLFITCAERAAHEAGVDVPLLAQVGPEVLPGSTRLKAGTATKILLNTLSTTVMMKLGHVYRGRMVDVVASNQKLRDRARRIVAELTGLPPDAAERLVKRAGGRAKLALAMHGLGVGPAEAARRLAAAGGDLHVLLAEGRPRSRGR